MVKSVKKALDALDFIILESLSKKGVTLGEIAACLRIQNTTARNILKTMEECGYLSRAAGRLYKPGTKCSDMIKASEISDRFLESARDTIREVARKTGESFVLATILNNERRVLFRARGEEIISIDSERAEKGGNYSVVTTRAFLAWIQPYELEAYIKIHGMPGSVWNGINTMDAFEKELSNIRNEGMATDHPNEAVVSFAVPLFNRKKNIIASIGAFAPIFRCDANREKQIISILQETAYEISSAI